ncbi:MAG: glycosyltransferase family 2 protein [Ruminococcaceae bacterium]|nr:glycosyltransferase family 2 protein [Oscillospiraceae bacterium]
MITVAVATYNGERYIEEQLDSLRLQTVSPDEVIICDDGSTDNTVAVCREFIEENGLSGWKVLQNEKNLGYCLNFYGAIEKANGDIIFLCDQDDIWDNNKIEIMLKTLEENPQISMLATRYRLVDGNGKPTDIATVPHYEANFSGTLEKLLPESFIGHSYIRGCATCFKSELKEKLKPIELRSLLGHDWLISMVSSLDGGAYCLNTPLMSYRCHENNVSFKADRSKIERRVEKRIAGLCESLEGHEYILSFVNDAKLKSRIERFMRFEKRRIKFLKSKNIFCFISLFFSLRQYSRYYNGGGFRVWLGDFVYAYKK